MMASREGPSGKIDVAAPPGGLALRAQYRGARARLMGSTNVAPAAPLSRVVAADAATKASLARRSGPEHWLAELITFNEELRRLFVRQAPTAAIRSGERIRAVVASHYGIGVAEIRGASSTRRCAWPRQVAMYICAREAALATPDIAQLFGNRDPSTVLYALRAVAARIERDPAVEQDISALIAKCRRGRLA
jgi:DnaA-like protein